jgi:uncharacterized membrane-anchored protein YjiN (DUF445 family)
VQAVRDRTRAQRLRTMRALATGLLAAMGVLYVATGLWLRHIPGIGYVRAFAEAGMVGACADWFAVTALFRRPLGLPIPHTAIIPRNRNRIGEALGAFIADNFLTAEVLESRLRQLEVGRWGAAWLRRPENAAVVADRIVALVPELLAMSTPAARRRFIGELAADAISAAPAAPLAAGLLRTIRDGERGAAILNAGLDLVAGLLARNEDLVRAEVAGRTYRWLPKWLDEKIADKILSGLAQTIEQMRAEGHPWRDRVRHAVDDLIDRLETDPRLAEQVEAFKRRLVASPALRERLGDIGQTLETWLDPRTEAERRALAHRLAGGLAAFAAWLGDEAVAVDIFSDWARQAALRLIAPRRHHIGRMIAGIVAGWDVGQLVDRLEERVGADLQYIRINGTLVGGLVGLAIYGLSGWFGLRA